MRPSPNSSSKYCCKVQLGILPGVKYVQWMSIFLTVLFWASKGNALKCHGCVYAEKGAMDGGLSTSDCLDPGKSTGGVEQMDCDAVSKSVDGDLVFGACETSVYNMIKYGRLLIRGCFDFHPYAAKAVLGRCVSILPNHLMPDFESDNVTVTISRYVIELAYYSKWFERKSNLTSVRYLTANRCACASDSCNNQPGLTINNTEIERESAALRLQGSTSWPLRLLSSMALVLLSFKIG